MTMGVEEMGESAGGDEAVLYYFAQFENARDF
jgi:hypothetical protein